VAGGQRTAAAQRALAPAQVKMEGDDDDFDDLDGPDAVKIDAEEEELDLYGDIMGTEAEKDAGSGEKKDDDGDAIDLYDDILDSGSAKTPASQSEGSGHAQAGAPAASSMAPNPSAQNTLSQPPDVKKKGKFIDPLSHDPLLASFKTPETVTAIFLGLFKWWTTDKKILEVCESVGVNDVKRIKIEIDPINGRSKGYALVELGSEASRQKLKDELPKFEDKTAEIKGLVVDNYHPHQAHQFEARLGIAPGIRKGPNGAPLLADPSRMVGGAGPIGPPPGRRGRGNGNGNGRPNNGRPNSGPRPPMDGRNFGPGGHMNDMGMGGPGMGMMGGMPQRGMMMNPMMGNGGMMNQFGMQMGNGMMNQYGMPNQGMMPGMGGGMNPYGMPNQGMMQQGQFGGYEEGYGYDEQGGTGGGRPKRSRGGGSKSGDGKRPRSDRDRERKGGRDRDRDRDRNRDRDRRREGGSRKDKDREGRDRSKDRKKDGEGSGGGGDRDPE